MLLVGSQSTTDDDSATVIFAKALPLGNAGRGLQMRGRGHVMPPSVGSGSGGDFFLVLRFVLFGADIPPSVLDGILQTRLPTALVVLARLAAGVGHMGCTSRDVFEHDLAEPREERAGIPARVGLDEQKGPSFDGETTSPKTTDPAPEEPLQAPAHPAAGQSQRE